MKESDEFMKKIVTLILAGFIVFGVGTQEQVYAAVPADKEISINIVSRMGIPSTSIGSGKTVNFIDNDGLAFYVPAGARVNFKVNLKSSASVELGYVRSSGSKVKTYSGTGKSHTTSFTISTTGYYKFYITNKSSGTITVTGGSLTF